MNQQNPYGAFRARAVRLPAWQIAIFGALAAGVVIFLAVFATAVFLLVFPAMIVLDWFYRWRNKTSVAAQPHPRETVITADYEVLPPDNDQRR